MYIFKPSRFVEKSTIILPATDEVKQSVGKRACCVIQQDGKKYNAKLERVFGVVDDPINEITAIAYSFGFTTDFSQEVMKEVENIPQEVTPQDMVNRVDMRDILYALGPSDCKG